MIKIVTVMMFLHKNVKLTMKYGHVPLREIKDCLTLYKTINSYGEGDK